MGFVSSIALFSSSIDLCVHNNKSLVLFMLLMGIVCSDDA